MMQILVDPLPPTGIFNIADVAIMTGMFMMLPFAFRRPKPEEETVATPGEDAPPAEAS